MVDVTGMSFEDAQALRRGKVDPSRCGVAVRTIKSPLAVVYRAPEAFTAVRVVKQGELLKQLMPPKKAIRLLGISVSGFTDLEPEDEDQLPLMLDGFNIRV